MVGMVEGAGAGMGMGMDEGWVDLVMVGMVEGAGAGTVVGRVAGVDWQLTGEAAVLPHTRVSGPRH